MKKRMLALLLVVTMVVMAFAGCAQTPVAPTPPTTPEDGAAKIEDTLEVAVFSNGDLMDAFWNKAISEFNVVYPDCKVTLIANPKIEDSMRPRFVAGTPPDIYYMGGSANMDEATLTADGKFMKLNDVFNNAVALGYEGSLKDNLGAQIFNKVGEDIYGMGFAYGVWGYYYNAKMAAQHGWAAPTTWKEFTELAPKIKEAGIYPIIHQGKYPDYMGYGLMQSGIATDGGKEVLVKMANLDAATYQSDLVVGAYKKFETIRENDWTSATALALTHTEAQMEWLLGKAFIIPCGNWLEGEMAADIPDGFEMGFMPSFWNDSGKTPNFVANSARISIAAEAKSPEAAKAFLAILYSKNMTKTIVEQQMGIPCMKDTLDGIEMSPSNKAVFSMVADGKATIINEVGGAGNFEPYPEQRTAINNNIAAILGGQKTAEQAIADLAAEITRIAGDAAIKKVVIS